MLKYTKYSVNGTKQCIFQAEAIFQKVLGSYPGGPQTPCDVTYWVATPLNIGWVDYPILGPLRPFYGYHFFILSRPDWWLPEVDICQRGLQARKQSHHVGSFR